MRTSENILNRQNFAFGNTENGYFWSYQNTDNQYRYSHKTTPNSTGKELDAETGYSYFGARYLDHTLTTAWLSVDPMADKYPSISPYAYCAWNPLKFMDPDGEEVILPWNKKIAKKIIDDLNAIYKAKYNTTKDAFVLGTGKLFGIIPYNKICASDEFDWNTDKYTKAMKECIDDVVAVQIQVVKNHNPDGPTLSRGRKINDFIKDLGGGLTSGNNVYISEDLPTYSSENGTKGKYAKKHCLGGIVMHELLYHLHRVGVIDAKEGKEQGASLMQQHYSLKNSRSHGPGEAHCFPSKKKK